MIETKVSYISLIENDVLRIEFKPNAYIDVAEFAENMEAYNRLMTTSRVYLLTVVTDGAMMSPEARNIFAGPERSSFKIAEAFVINTLAQRIVANFVMRVQKPLHTIKIFSNEKDALSWLLSLRSK